MRLLRCPRCGDTWLDNNVCPLCKFSMEDAVELIEEMKSTGEFSYKDRDCIYAEDEECQCSTLQELRKRIRELEEENKKREKERGDNNREQNETNAENWKLKTANRKLRRRLRKLGANYNGPCPVCENIVVKNKCQACSFEGNRIAVELILNKRRGGE